MAATPNWFGAAQNCEGGSPASLPVPVDPYGGRIRYAPQFDELDVAAAAQDSAWAETGSGPDRERVSVGKEVSLERRIRNVESRQERGVTNRGGN